ncbi:MAG: hypothetical protein OHK0029_33150 [Armatimonadaceae bacterium]
MIRIKKSPTAPEILQTRGCKERDTLCAEYDSGSREFNDKKFRKSIYAHDEVKQQLVADHKEKCCFCERVVSNSGEVEHYRPKSAVQQERGSSPSSPGYYWLAYEWANLNLTCRGCNGQKGILFPLENEDTRACCHHDDLALEEPCLLNPNGEDPEIHITWRGEVAVGETAKGRKTIELLRLNDIRKRNDLLIARRSKIAEVKQLWDILRLEELLGEQDEVKMLIANARRFINQAQAEDAPFAAMIRAALRTNFADAVTENGSLR